MQKSKAYYRALCACLGLLVVGGATAYYGISQFSQKPTPQQKPLESQELPTPEAPTAEVIYNQSMALKEAKAQREEKKKQTDAKQKNDENTKTDGAENAGETATTPEVKVSPKQQENPPAAPAQDSATAEPIFQTPLTGEVVMDYSMEHAIYDPTLEQFRTNNCLSIAGKEGDTVKASADGTVANVVEQVERGITVVIHHNNGWETTYSQLQDNVLVKKGDQVKQGQEIGMVAKPTKYGAALGEHLDFAVIKDGEYVDPKSALAQ